MRLQRLIALVLTSICWSSTFGQSAKPVNSPGEMKQRDLLRIYRNAIQQFDQRMIDFLFIESPEGAQQASDFITTNAQIVATHNLPGQFKIPPEEMLRLKCYALPEVVRHRVKFGTDPTTETLRNFFRLNAKHYPLDEWITGREIFISEAAWGSETSATVERIARLLRDQPFAQVAALYYDSLGQKYDGRFSRAKRSDMPEWKFSFFIMSDREKPYFGPVIVPGGYLFGKLESQFQPGEDTFQAYLPKVRADYHWVYSQRAIADLVKRQEANLRPIRHSYESANPSPRSQVAYEVSGTTVTFEEAHKRMPFLLGDMSNPKFWDSVSSQSLQNDLIFFSAEAREAQDSPEFEYLEKAVADAFLVSGYIKSKLAGMPAPDDEHLRQFYTKQQKRYYAQPDLIELSLITVTTSGTARLATGREVANRIRDQYAAAPTSASLQRIQTQFIGVDVLNTGWRKTEDLGRVVEMAAGDEQAGFISPVSVDQNGNFFFFHILRREKQPPLAFEEVLPRLRQEYQEYQREELLEELYGPESFPRMFPD